jgi:hypothetical protein
VTYGYPSESTENTVQANIVATGYGSSIVSTRYGTRDVITVPAFKINYNLSIGEVVMSYYLPDTRRVSINIFDQQGKRITSVLNGIIPAGNHEAVWSSKRVPAGVYVCKVVIDGMAGWTGKIVTGK